MIGTRSNIANKSPIIGKYNVNMRGSDLYSKGANVLHTLRQIFNNDESWRNVLRGLNKEFYHKTVTTDEIEQFIDDKLDLNLKPFFNQYLRDPRVPVFDYYFSEGFLYYRWKNVIDNFEMPIEIKIDKETIVLNATTSFKKLKVESYNNIKVDKDYYVFVNKK